MPNLIGQQLKEAREKQNLSLKQVVDEIHIREAYLLALEENRIETLLSPVQSKGFLRLYAEFLGINPFVKAVSSNPEITGSEDLTEADSSSNKQELRSGESEDLLTLLTHNFGDQFLMARKEKALEFSDVEAELHIGRNYLLAIENEDFEALPQGIQARGMIQRYAKYLELNPEEILGEYADILISQQTLVENDKGKRKQARKINGAKQILTPDLIIGLGLVIAILVIGFFSIRKVISTRNILITNEPTSEAVFFTNTPTLDPETTPAEEPGQGTAIPAEIPTSTLQVRPTNQAEGITNSRVIVQIIANQRAYLRITADGETVFDGRVKGGVIYEYFAEDRIELLTGNGAALDITVIQDGIETKLGTLGLVGQVVNLTFQPDIIITPTVTPSLTPTVTNTPLPTMSPTTTSSPTPSEEQ